MLRLFEFLREMDRNCESCHYHIVNPLYVKDDLIYVLDQNHCILDTSLCQYNRSTSKFQHHYSKSKVCSRIHYPRTLRKHHSPE